jgi:hypothetical protein
MSIARKRCLNHPSREAVARCTACDRYFCRECVSEHDDRIFCARCLKDVDPVCEKRPSSGLLLAVQALAGLLFLWASFHVAGKALLAIPPPVHQESTLNDERR